MNLDFEKPLVYDEEENVYKVAIKGTDKYKELQQDFSIEDWDSAEVFKLSGIRGYEPMTAKELDTEEKQDEALNNTTDFIEEKFDGTRGLVYLLSQDEVLDNDEIIERGYCRVFSRRISKKTGFYVENSDSVPQIKEIDVPSLGGTVLDGEMFINGRPFKEVSSTLNCLWDKAIERQTEKGFISLHAFDILFYKGIDLRKMPLERRKVYLHLAVKEANSPYIEEVEYYECGKPLSTNLYKEVAKRINDFDEDSYFTSLEDNKKNYPNLYNCWKNNLPLTPRAYYELIVSTGGEGVIVKPKDGHYNHKRGWEYSKIKKFLTRELVLIRFDKPTREYKGKAPKNWAYYEGDTPVTKYYYNRLVGNMILGVVITKEELEAIPEKKRGYVHNFVDVCKGYEDDPDVQDLLIMEVCECGGYSDEQREYFTRRRLDLEGKITVEVKANEIFKDTGKLRHPRFLRTRLDKEPTRCIWKDHIQSV